MPDDAGGDGAVAVGVGVVVAVGVVVVVVVAVAVAVVVVVAVGVAVGVAVAVVVGYHRTVNPLRLALGAALVATAALLRSSSSRGATGPSLRLVEGVPLAVGGAPTWPVLTKHPQRFSVGHVTSAGKKVGNQSRRFGASREGRHHAGVDLYGYPGDVVVATESGVVTAIDPSWHLGTGALWLATDSGLTLTYGEIDSWAAFGIGPGSRVSRGQKLARIGCMRHDADGDCKSHMLHFEAYQGRRTTNIKWPVGAKPPAELRDPTAYLLRAAR